MSHAGAYLARLPSAGPPLREELQQTGATRAQPLTTVQIPEYREEDGQKDHPVGKKSSRIRGEMKIRVDPRSYNAAPSPKSPKSPTRAKYARKPTDKSDSVAKPARNATHDRRPSMSMSEPSGVDLHHRLVQPEVGYDYHSPPQTPSNSTILAGTSTLQYGATPDGSMLFTNIPGHSPGHLGCPIPTQVLHNPQTEGHRISPMMQKHVQLHPYLSPAQDVSPSYPSAPSPTPSAVSTSSSSTSSSGYSHLGFTRISSPWSPPPSPTPEISPSTPYALTPQALRYKPLEDDRIPRSQSGAQRPTDMERGLRQIPAMSTERPGYPSVKFQVKGGSEPGVRIDKVVGALYDPTLENGDTRPFEIYNAVKVHYTWPGYDTHTRRLSTLDKRITVQQLMLAVCTEFHKWATSKTVRCANHQHLGWALGSDVDPMNVFVTELVHLGGADWQLICTPALPRQQWIDFLAASGRNSTTSSIPSLCVTY